MTDDTKKQESDEIELPQPWKKVQSAIWLIGLAILFYTGWWMPGILVLVAISGLTQAGLKVLADRQAAQAQTAAAARAAALAVPANCPTCGAAINASAVTWTGATTAHCPYCKAAIPLNTAA